ncbi:hypothetical protein KRX19_03630 [Cardiobacteriaceae bacterium TAE3-ERU3]|nr:hypothetical protein [Cardiobacteriaceae bacterium TAE3-ERU3]
MYATDSKSIRTIIVGVFAAGLLQFAHAFGLGPITVNSHLGEPLRATINVTDLDASQKGNTVVSVAGSEAYRSRGIEKLPSHEQLRVSLQSSATGHYINISTPNIVREPFITFVLSVKHNGKETLREYTVFLDPATDGLAIPSITSPAKNDIDPAEGASDASSKIKLLVNQPAAATSNGWQGKPSKPIESASDRIKKDNWQGRSYGPVKKGETLFSIAEKVRPSPDYPIQTIMRQIYRENPSAFNSNQLSSLMAGYRLSIPVFTKELVPLPADTAKSTASTAKSIKQAAPINSEAANVASDTSVVQVQEVNDVNEKAGQDDNSDGQKIEEGSISLDVVASGDSADFASNSEESNVGSVLHNTDSEVDQSEKPNLTALSNLNPESVEGEFESEAVEMSDRIQRTDGSIATESQENVVLANMDNTVEEHDNTVVSGNAQQSSNDGAAEGAATTTASVANPELSTSDLVIEEERSVDKQASQSFLSTTYAFLPMWQWLVIGALLLASIALLLFRQRKKHEVDAYDTLDEDEMDAVLAKINALEREDGHENVSAKPMLTELDSYPDFENNNIEQSEWKNEIALDELDDYETDQHDKATEGWEGSSERDPDIAVEKEDYDFFLAENEEVAETRKSEYSHIEKDLNFDIDLGSLERNFGTTADLENLSEEDNLDFFSEKPNNEAVELNPILNEDPSEKGDLAWLDEENDLDDLFISDSNFEQENASESSTSTDQKKLEVEVPFVADEVLADSAEPAVAVNTAEMEINLDLAVSFIATGHGERAIIWLEEVLEVGTDEQKARAKALMDKVRGA